MMNIKHIIFVLAALVLSGCGGATGPVTIDCSVPGSCVIDSDLIVNGNVTVVAPGAGASAPSPGASAPVPPPTPPTTPPPAPTPLATVQRDTLPYVVPCAGCLQWASGGVRYALVFRDSGIAQLALTVACSLADCAPGQGVWNGVASLGGFFEDELHKLPATDNAALMAYGRDVLFPELQAWFAANAGNLANGFTHSTQSTLTVPETGQAFDRLAAIFARCTRINDNATVQWTC